MTPESAPISTLGVCVDQKEADTPISATVSHKYNTLTGLVLAFSLGCEEGNSCVGGLCQNPHLCISGQSTAAVPVDRDPAGAADPMLTSLLAALATAAY